MIKYIASGVMHTYIRATEGIANNGPPTPPGSSNLQTDAGVNLQTDSGVQLQTDQ